MNDLLLVQLFSKGGPVMWPLLALSLLSLTITVERTIFWIKDAGRQNDETVRDLLTMVEAGEIDKALSMGAESRDSSVRAVASGLEHFDAGFEKITQMAAQNEISRMRQGLVVLDTIITLAPLLGILGTVTGIINSFDMLGQSNVLDPKVVTGGIAQALITTAAGLTIAIATLIPFNFFVSRTQAATNRMELLATSVEVALDKVARTKR